MNDAERIILTNILGHLRLASQGQQAAYTQLKMAEEKMQRLLGPSVEAAKVGSEPSKPTPPK